MKASILLGLAWALLACSAVPTEEATDDLLASCTANPGQPCCLAPYRFPIGPYYYCTQQESFHTTCVAPTGDPEDWTLCIRCGAPGDHCCCSQMSEDGTCINQLGCNAGSICNEPAAGTDPFTTQCEACGGPGQACCAGSTCNAGYGCQDIAHECPSNIVTLPRPTCEPTACGAPGQACCAGNTCNGTGSTCGNGTCGCPTLK